MKVLLLGSGGYWAKNVLKNLEKFEDLDIICIEPNEKAWPDPKKYTTYLNVFDAIKANTTKFGPFFEAAFVCTPISNHYETTKILLNNKINCIVQKPLAANTKDAKELVRLAEVNNVVLMVAHTFLFSSAIRKLKNLIEYNTLGTLRFFHADWSNLGLFQRDADVLLDLGPHPFSILKYINPKTSSFISAVGTSHAKTNYINSANISIGYDDNFQAYIHLNWLSPKKTRQITIAGDKKMIVYDDASADEKIKIYDCGVDEDENSRFSYRKGQITIPKIEESEAIYNEISYFLQCVDYSKNPDKISYISDGQFGVEVVKMIEMASMSVSKNGSPMYL